MGTLTRQVAKKKYCSSKPVTSSELRSSVLYAIHKTELRKEAPVHFIEIYKFWKMVEQTDSNGGPKASLADFQ